MAADSRFGAGDDDAGYAPGIWAIGAFDARRAGQSVSVSESIRRTIDCRSSIGRNSVGLGRVLCQSSAGCVSAPHDAARS